MGSANRGVKPFVDTNVLVYANDPADAAKQRTARNVLLEHAASIVLSAQVLSEFYVVVTRRLAIPMTSRDARAIVADLGRYPVVAPDRSLVLDAIDLSRRSRIAYWDGLIVAAARRANCDVVLTEDLSHGATIGGIRIENPFRPD